MDCIFRIIFTYYCWWIMTLCSYSTRIFLRKPMPIRISLLICLIFLLSSCTLPGTVSE
jgi:hypothetical protein